MKIVLNNVTPDPLLAQQQSGKGIWPLSFEFNSSNTYLITSASGKGKTSLLMFMYGIRNDYQGYIDIDDTNIALFPPKRWSELRSGVISIVFQNLRLFGELTGYDNIALNARLSGEPDAVAIERMADALGIREELYRPCNMLSFGQQQRIALIRALIQPFRFLFLDEPFSHLDGKNREYASELVSEIAKKNDAGIILTSLGETYPIDIDEEISLD